MKLSQNQGTDGLLPKGKNQCEDRYKRNEEICNMLQLQILIQQDLSEDQLLIKQWVINIERSAAKYFEMRSYPRYFSAQEFEQLRISEEDLIQSMLNLKNRLTQHPHLQADYLQIIAKIMQFYPLAKLPKILPLFFEMADSAIEASNKSAIQEGLTIIINLPNDQPIRDWIISRTDKIIKMAENQEGFAIFALVCKIFMKNTKIYGFDRFKQLIEMQPLWKQHLKTAAKFISTTLLINEPQPIKEDLISYLNQCVCLTKDEEDIGMLAQCLMKHEHYMKMLLRCIFKQSSAYELILRYLSNYHAEFIQLYALEMAADQLQPLEIIINKINPRQKKQQFNIKMKNTQIVQFLIFVLKIAKQPSKIASVMISSRLMQRVMQVDVLRSLRPQTKHKYISLLLRLTAADKACKFIKQYEILADLSSQSKYFGYEAKNIYFIESIYYVMAKGQQAEGSNENPFASWLGSLRKDGLIDMLMGHPHEQFQEIASRISIAFPDQNEL